VCMSRAYTLLSAPHVHSAIYNGQRSGHLPRFVAPLHLTSFCVQSVHKVVGTSDVDILPQPSRSGEDIISSLEAPFFRSRLAVKCVESIVEASDEHGTADRRGRPYLASRLETPQFRAIDCGTRPVDPYPSGVCPKHRSFPIRHAIGASATPGGDPRQKEGDENFPQGPRGVVSGPEATGQVREPVESLSMLLSSS
jgi:hypothetical protein